MLNLADQHDMESLIRRFLAAHPTVEQDRQRVCLATGLDPATLLLHSAAYAQMAAWGREQGLIDQTTCWRVVTLARQLQDASHNQQED